MKCKFVAAAALSVGLTLALATPSSATLLVANVGWQQDEILASGIPSVLSPFTFTIAPGYTGSFALTDAFVPGDVYSVKLFGTDEGSSVFGLYGDGYFDNSLGLATYSAAWDNIAYSHYLVLFGVGDFSFSVSGNGKGGLPAHFGYRLDTVKASVPEPASWALMIGGFGLAGAALRRRRASVVTA